MREPVLTLEAVGRVHGRGHTAVVAVEEVSLELAPGELVAVTGRSGAGKSTLLNLAGGLDVPTSGCVRVDGHDLARLDPVALAALRRRRIGMVFQHGNLLPTLTAAENVALPLELDGTRPAAARTAALAALRAVDAEPVADRFPDELSGASSSGWPLPVALSVNDGCCSRTSPPEPSTR